MDQKNSITAQHKDKRAAAVVVTYNRAEMLKQCLAHLAVQTYPCDILVINNACTDGTDVLLAEYSSTHSNIHVCNLPVNSGGAGGFNRGMRLAAEKGYDYIWVMDDDCFPEPDALEKLMEADDFLGGEYGWLSSTALWTDGSECRMNRQKRKRESRGGVRFPEYSLVQAEQATFVSLFLRTSTVVQFGLPISEYWIWGDDIEFTRRIAVRNNMRSFIAGQSRVVHAMKENTGSSIAADHENRISRYKYAFRNENHLYRMEGLQGFLYYSAKCGLNILRILFYAKNHKVKRCRIIIEQFFTGLTFNPKIEKVSKRDEI